MLTIPNLITFSGTISILIFFILFTSNVWLPFSFAFLCWGYIADNLDGYIARKLNQTSSFGALIDLFSDKVREILLSVLIIFQYPDLQWVGYVFLIWAVSMLTIVIPKQLSEQGLKPISKIMEVCYHIRHVWLILILMGLYFPYFEVILLVSLILQVREVIKINGNQKN